MGRGGDEVARENGDGGGDGAAVADDAENAAGEKDGAQAENDALQPVTHIPDYADFELPASKRQCCAGGLFTNPKTFDEVPETISKELRVDPAKATATADAFFQTEHTKITDFMAQRNELMMQCLAIQQDISAHESIMMGILNNFNDFTLEVKEEARRLEGIQKHDCERAMNLILDEVFLIVDGRVALTQLVTQNDRFRERYLALPGEEKHVEFREKLAKDEMKSLGVNLEGLFAAYGSQLSTRPAFYLLILLWIYGRI